MALQPAAGIGEQGEAGRVAFRETVITEPLDLLEQVLAIFQAEAVFQHARQQLFAMRFQAATTLPGGHRAAQCIGFAGFITSCFHCQLHHLFLEQRHAQRACEHAFQLWWVERIVRVVQRVRSLFAQDPPPLKVGMDHVTLDRAGSHDRHLDHQVIELAWLHAWQHRHLRARLDLEHADGVGGADHVVGRAVFIGDRIHASFMQAVLLQHRQAFADGGEHAQRQAVDLHQAGGIQIVLVPLDDGAVGHRRVFYRHQGRQRMLGDDETARMLRQVAWEVDQLGGQCQQPPHQGCVRIETALAEGFRQRDAATPVVHRRAEFVDLVHRQAERTGDVADRAAATVADCYCGQCGALAAIALEHVLQHFLAALVLEVDVDVRRLIALGGDEAFKQQIAARRIDLGHAQHKAHRRIGRRATPLAEDVLAAGEAHDVMHGKEVGGVVFSRINASSCSICLRCAS